MKILFLHNSFLPEYSGSSIRLYNLLSRLPYSVSVITSDVKLNKEKIMIKEEIIDNINIKRISLEPKNRIWNFPPLRYLYREKLLLKKVKSEEFDIIQTRSIPLFMVSARKISEKLKKPFIIEYSVYERSTVLTDMYNYYLVKIAKILQSSEHIITMTDKLKKYAIKKHQMSENKITVIKNGVDTGKFAPKKEYNDKSTDLKNSLKLSGNIIMYAGYMDKINGITDLLNILPSLLKENDDISFLLIGNGPEANNIRKISNKYSQSVKYLPSAPYDDMPLYYQMCDVFIIPRPSTTPAELITPLKLLEVMAMEKPVLSSDVGGIAEVIEHENNGYLFEKGNMTNFKEELIKILKTEDSQIGERARKTMLNNYNWDKSAKELENVYENLVEHLK